MLFNLSMLMLKHINASNRSRVKEVMEIEETEKNLSDILYKLYWTVNCIFKYLTNVNQMK